MSDKQPAKLSRSELERRRTRALRDVDIEGLREEPALEGVAEAAAAVCDVPMAQISITDAGSQCVVGQIGMSYEDYACGGEVQPDSMVEDRIVIIEDVADDDSFETDRFDRFFGKVRFYGGIPLIVDHTPVGGLVVLDTEPRELDQFRRAALFGLVHEVESHLRVHRDLDGDDPPAEQLSVRLTSMVAHATRLRWLEEANESVYRVLSDLEDQIDRARESLEDLVCEQLEGADVEAGDNTEFAKAAPTQKGQSTLGYIETDVEDLEN